MNQWAFVMAAYGLFALATAGLVFSAWRSMRIAEMDAEATRRRR